MKEKEHYTPCRSCGGTAVFRTLNWASDGKRVRVLVECKGCGNFRASYTRKERFKDAEKIRQ